MAEAEIAVHLFACVRVGAVGLMEVTNRFAMQENNCSHNVRSAFPTCREVEAFNPYRFQMQPRRVIKV